MNCSKRNDWSWWQAELLLGLLYMSAVHTADMYLAVSTTFSRAAGDAWRCGNSNSGSN
jgi:hypothetical protein